MTVAVENKRLDLKVQDALLFVGPEFEPPRGGIAQIMHNYKQYLFSPGHFHYVANSCQGNKLVKLWKLVSSLIIFIADLLAHHGLRIVHIHTASRFSFWRSALFVKLARLLGRKVVMHVHGGGFREYYHDGHQQFVKCVLSRCDIVVVLSQEWRDFFIKEVECTKVVVIPNLIAPAESANVSQNLLGGCGKLHLLFLGLISDDKGIFDLLQVMAEHKPELEGKFVLHVAGAGEVDRMYKVVDDCGMTGMVIYEGWVAGTKKSELFCTCDALILPSYYEGLPLSVLEAMTYGMPILATNIGGIPSVVHDGFNGFLFAPGDKQAMFVAIDRYVNDKVLCQSMGINSCHLATPYLPDAVAANLRSLYSTLLLQQ